MKTSKWILSFAVLCLLFNGCGVMTESPVSIEAEKPELVATNTVPENNTTSTVPLATATPTEESILDTPTLTIVPTPTLVMGIESEIDPYIVREIEGEYKGIKIKARIVIDRSLEYMVKSFEVRNESHYVQVLAELLAEDWYTIEYQGRNAYAHYVTIRQTGQYFPLWQKAQESGNESDWRKVQLNEIWANDLNDGNGYVQNPYTLWPMYEGEVPEGVRAFNRITVVVIDLSNSDITNIQRDVVISHATHIIENDLVIYSGIDFKITNEKRLLHLYPPDRDNEWFLIFSFADFSCYLIGNFGDGDNSYYYSHGISDAHFSLVKYGFDITYK